MNLQPAEKNISLDDTSGREEYVNFQSCQTHLRFQGEPLSFRTSAKDDNDPVGEAIIPYLSKSPSCGNQSLDESRHTLGPLTAVHHPSPPLLVLSIQSQQTLTRWVDSLD